MKNRSFDDELIKSYRGGAGYKTLLLAVYKTSLFSGGPKWLVIRLHFFSKFPSGCL